MSLQLIVGRVSRSRRQWISKSSISNGCRSRINLCSRCGHGRPQARSKAVVQAFKVVSPLKSRAIMYCLTLVSANWEIWPRTRAHRGPVNSGPVQILLIPSL